MLFFSFSPKCKISSLKEKVKIISESELEICALIYRPQLESISVSIFLFTSVAIACKRGCFSLLIAPEGRLLPHSKSCLFQWGFSSDGQMMLEGSTFRLSKCYFSRLFHTERSWFSVVFVFGREDDLSYDARSFSVTAFEGIFRNGLLGASICAVPLSQPIPVKNYF